MCEALCGYCEGAPSAERVAEGDTERHAATKKTTKQLFVASRPGTRQQFPCHARCVRADIASSFFFPYCSGLVLVGGVRKKGELKYLLWIVGMMSVN
jgi:hypothetical protein